MSTILTNTGVTFPDGSTQASSGYTPHVVCKAYITTSPTITTSPSSWALVPINAATYDNSGSFDATNHRFVIPNTGYYCVSYLVGVGSPVSYFGTAIGVNGTPLFSENIFQGDGTSNPSAGFIMKGTSILTFNSGDTVSVYVMGYGNISYSGCCCCVTNYSYQITAAVLDIHQIRF